MMEQRRNVSKKSNNQHIRARKSRHFPTVKLFILLIAFCVGAWFFLNYISANDSGHDIPIRPFNISESTQTGSQILTYEQLSEMNNNQLLLINSDYKIPYDLSDGLVKVLDYVRTLNTDNLLNKDALLMLKEMFDSAADAGYNEFRVTDGYRTHECQKSLYDSIENKSLVALPGHSEHQTGLAADISYNGVNIENSKQGTWLADNSYKYGFILRYPKNKEDITKIPYEAWHYRYVGQPHAHYCYKNDLCFEEYIDYLKKHKEIITTVNKVEYKIYYLSGNNETIEIPENYWYSVSLDNTGGIIVTASIYSK